MDSFNRTNLQHIKNIFEEKTGVALNTRPQHRRRPVKAAILVAAALVCSLTMTAFAVSLFSSLSGDDLGLSASYDGNGIVSIQVENRSDKDLCFQPQLKLKQWSTGEEVASVSSNILFGRTDFDAHTSGIMTVDISGAYDMDALEQPLTDDHYYFVLTNNNFVFGQDWMCSVDFADPVEAPVKNTAPAIPAEADKELVAKVTEELRSYFYHDLTDPAVRNDRANEYWAACQELLASLHCNVVTSVSPMLLVECMDPPVVFDDTVAPDQQYCLVGQNRYALDGYGIPVGATDTERALVLSAYIPQHKGETDGGAGIPLIYIFTYRADDTKDPANCAFIHGQLLTFEEMEQYKVYQDDQYACYEVTDLFYTDLRQYVESMVSQRSDVYFDEQIWTRVQNIYNCYTDKEELSSRFFYKDTVSTK